MDFGRADDLNQVDFTLPPDHAITKDLLKSLKPNKQPVQLYVGCAKWGREDWIGKVYPKGTKAKDFLAHYVKYFNCIELNAMFYQLQPKPVIERWAALADNDFRFCPKFTKAISHLKQLKNADRETDVFLEHMMSFGEKLGYCFLQLSERFAPNRAGVIQDYVRKLPRDFKACVEVRHENWFANTAEVNEMYELFRELKVGTAITDTAGRRDCLHMKLTAPVAFIRYVGNSMHPTDFTRIDSWVDRIKKWMDSGLKEIYFFIHNHDELYSPELSKYAIEQFNKKCGTKLKVPPLLNE